MASLIHLAIKGSRPFIIKELRLKSSINLGFGRHRQLVLSLCWLNHIGFPLVILSNFLLHLDIVANLQLIFDQILSLSK